MAQVETAIKMADTYVSLLASVGIEPQQIKKHDHVPVKYYRLRHIMWMSQQAKEFALSGNVVKAQRWLGFVQGVLWSHELRSVDDLRKDNTTLAGD